MDYFFWLFNDLLIYGRKSEFFAIGKFRFLDKIDLKSVRVAKEYGENTIEISDLKEKKWLLCFNNKHSFNSWMNDLRGFVKTKEEEEEKRKKERKKEGKDEKDEWILQADGRYFNGFLKQHAPTKPVFVKVKRKKERINK